jgi:HK97 family phage prohead protease
METNMELRTYRATELRADDSTFSLQGYAASFNVLSNDLGSFKEKIAPGAFDDSLDDDASDVRCTYNHSMDTILGRQKNGTLKLDTDQRGLKFRCQLDRNQSGHRDVYAAVKRGDIDACSFAFQADADGQSWDDNGVDENGQRCTVRTLKRVKLFDVAVVSQPAYPSTQVQARASAAAIEKLRNKLHIAVNGSIARLENSVGNDGKLTKKALAEITKRLARSMPSTVTLAAYRAAHTNLSFEQWFEDQTGRKILPKVAMAVRRAMRAAPRTDEERKQRAKEIEQDIYNTDVRRWLATVDTGSVIDKLFGD